MVDDLVQVKWSLDRLGCLEAVLARGWARSVAVVERLC